MRPEYQRLSVSADICTLVLEDINVRLPLARYYTIYAGRYAFDTAKRIQAAATQASLQNPFAPALNVMLVPDFNAHEWCIESGDTRYGCDPT